MLPRRECMYVCVCVHWNNAAWQIFEDSSSSPAPAAAQVAVVVVVIVQLGIGYKHIIRSLVSLCSGLHCAGVSDGEWAMNLLATFSINLSLGMCQTLRFDSSSSSSSSYVVSFDLWELFNLCSSRANRTTCALSTRRATSE